MTEKIEEILLITLAFLVPIIILPISINPFVVPKLALLVCLSVVCLAIKTVKAITKGQVKLSIGKFDAGLLLLLVSYLLSSLFKTPNKMEAFLLPGVTSYTSAAIILYMLVNQTKEETKNKIKLGVYLAGIVLSVVSLLSISGIFQSMAFLPAYVKMGAFSPSGNSLTTFIFLVTIAPIGISEIVSQKDNAKKAFAGVSVAVIAFGIITTSFSAFLDKANPLQLPPFNTSWAVAIETIKESPILGVGAGNYLTAFSKFRPLSYNYLDFWATKFVNARSYYLTIITELGLLGTVALTVIGTSLYRSIKAAFRERKLVGWGSIQYSIFSALMILLIFLALFPADITLVVLLLVLFSLSTKTTEIKLTPDIYAAENKLSGKFPVLVVTLPVAIALLIVTYYSIFILVGEYHYKRAIDAVTRNQGKEAYDLLRLSITRNPFVDRYHLSYLQVNLALANSLIQKQEITDHDRTAITRFIQQAIREGKAAIALNPTRASNWLALANTYRSIMPVAAGADQFAIQTYSQAIVLDPFNPILRINLGGIFYGQEHFEDAIDIFKLATRAKPDHANAHYNLAIAYREHGDINQAISEMSTVLSLVDRSSNDYELARRELESLQTKKAEKEAKSTQIKEGSELVPPEPAQEPALEPQIKLPEDAAPPASPNPGGLSPSATPTASPSGSPTPSPSPSPTLLP